MEKTFRGKNPWSTNRGSPDAEMPDLAAEQPTLEGEDSPPVFGDVEGSPVSEAPINEDEDLNEGERQVEEPDHRGVPRDSE